MNIAPKSKDQLFREARADFYDSAVTLLNAWQAAEESLGATLFTHAYPFDEDFTEVVAKIGKWSDSKIDDELPVLEESDLEDIIDDFDDPDDDEELEGKEPTVD